MSGAINIIIGRAGSSGSGSTRGVSISEVSKITDVKLEEKDCYHHHLFFCLFFFVRRRNKEREKERKKEERNKKKRRDLCNEERAKQINGRSKINSENNDKQH